MTGAFGPTESVCPVCLRTVPARRERDGEPLQKIARELGVHPSTVGRWFTAAHLPDSTDVEEATP